MVQLGHGAMGTQGGTLGSEAKAESAPCSASISGHHGSLGIWDSCSNDSYAELPVLSNTEFSEQEVLAVASLAWMQNPE